MYWNLKRKEKLDLKKEEKEKAWPFNHIWIYRYILFYLVDWSKTTFTYHILFREVVCCSFNCSYFKLQWLQLLSYLISDCSKRIKNEFYIKKTVTNYRNPVSNLETSYKIRLALQLSFRIALQFFFALLRSKQQPRQQSTNVKTTTATIKMIVTNENFLFPAQTSVIAINTIFIS